jgi:hypothetical protein
MKEVEENARGAADLVGDLITEAIA